MKEKGTRKIAVRGARMAVAGVKVTSMLFIKHVLTFTSPVSNKPVAIRRRTRTSYEEWKFSMENRNRPMAIPRAPVTKSFTSRASRAKHLDSSEQAHVRQLRGVDFKLALMFSRPIYVIWLCGVFVRCPPSLGKDASCGSFHHPSLLEV